MTSELVGIHSNKKQAREMNKYLDSLNNKKFVNVENDSQTLELENDEKMIAVLNKIYNEIIQIKVRLDKLDNKKQ